MNLTGTAFAFLVAATAGGAFGAVALARPGSTRIVRLASLALRAAAALAAVAFLARWMETGHLPLFGSYEGSLSLALSVVVIGVAVEEFWRARGFFAGPTGFAAAAILFHGGRFSTEAWALTISEQSLVVHVHAIVAWAAFGALAIHAAVAVAHLVPRGVERIDPEGRRLSRSLEVGFFLHSAMIATGSFYSFLLFGKAWSFDPIETLAILVWLSLGTILHLHRLAGFEGNRLARWSLVVFLLLGVSYRAILHYPPSSTYHIFDIDRRIHDR